MWKKKKLILKTKKINLYKSHPDRDESLELLIYFYNSRLIHNLYIYFVGSVHGGKFKCLYAKLQSKRNVKYDAIKICFYLKEYPRQDSCTYMLYEKAHACQCFSIYSWSYSHNLLLDNNSNEYKQHNLKQTLFIFLLLYIYILFFLLFLSFFPIASCDIEKNLMNFWWIYIYFRICWPFTRFSNETRNWPLVVQCRLSFCVFFLIFLFIFFFVPLLMNMYLMKWLTDEVLFSDESFLFCLLLLCFFLYCYLELERLLALYFGFIKLCTHTLGLTWFIDWLFY